MQNGNIRTGRAQTVFAALIMALFLAMAWQAREDTDLEGSDELEYRALSQSLAQGSYREIFQITEPWSVKYPPAFPALILTLRAVTGDHLDGVRLANIILVGIGLTLLFLCVRQFAGGWVALGVLLVSALNPYTLGNAGSMMSEAMYFCLTCIVLYAMFAAERGKTSWAIPVIMIVPMVAFLTRTAGLTIVAAAGVWILMRRPRREVFAYAAIAAVVVGAWFVYAKYAPHDMAASYARDFSDAREGANPNPVIRVAERMAKSGFVMATSTSIQTFALPTIERTVADNLAWIVVMAVLIPVGIFVLWKTWQGMVIYLAIYAVLLIAWPYTGFRILSVIVPFVFLAMFLGLKALISRFSSRVALPVFGTLTLLMLIGATTQNADRFEDGAMCNRAEPLALYGCHDAVENVMLKSRAFLAKHAVPNDIIATSKGASMYFLTNLKTTPARYLAEYRNGAVVDTLRARGIRFVVVGVIVPHEDGPLVDALLPRCNELRVEANDMPVGVMLSVLPPGDTTGDACSVLPPLRRAITASPP